VGGLRSGSPFVLDVWGKKNDQSKKDRKEKGGASTFSFIICQTLYPTAEIREAVQGEETLIINLDKRHGGEVRTSACGKTIPEKRWLSEHFLESKKKEADRVSASGRLEHFPLM